MIALSSDAVQFLREMVQGQGERGLNLRLTVLRPGSPLAECDLAFCPPGTEMVSDLVQVHEGFTLFIDHEVVPFLEGARIEYEKEGVSANLNIIAPKIRGKGHLSLFDQVTALLESEINPALASHKGMCRLVEITEAKEVVLQFGGGCHGCGMVDVTLKQGIEKTIRERIPEITAVKDSTDHDTGENPYYA